MKMPWERSVVDVPGPLPLFDAMEKRGVGGAAPMVFAERPTAGMTLAEEDATRCDGCGHTAACRSRHAPGCPEMQPCEHCVPEDAGAGL